MFLNNKILIFIGILVPSSIFCQNNQEASLLFYERLSKLRQLFFHLEPDAIRWMDSIQSNIRNADCTKEELEEGILPASELIFSLDWNKQEISRVQSIENQRKLKNYYFSQNWLNEYFTKFQDLDNAINFPKHLHNPIALRKETGRCVFPVQNDIIKQLSQSKFFQLIIGGFFQYKKPYPIALKIDAESLEGANQLLERKNILIYNIENPIIFVLFMLLTQQSNYTCIVENNESLENHKKWTELINGLFPGNQINYIFKSDLSKIEVREKWDIVILVNQEDWNICKDKKLKYALDNTKYNGNILLLTDKQKYSKSKALTEISTCLNLLAFELEKEITEKKFIFSVYQKKKE